MPTELEKNLAALPSLAEDHLSDWHTVLSESAKDPDPLTLRGTGVSLGEALESQKWAKTVLPLLEAEIVRRWKTSVELTRS